MLSLFLPTLCSLDRVRHSMGRIFLYIEDSISVNCRANSSGSMSSSFSFLLVLGRIGGGGGAFVTGTVLTPTSPFCYYMRKSELVYLLELSIRTTRSICTTSCLAAAIVPTSGLAANSRILSKMYMSSFSKTSSSMTIVLKVFNTLYHKVSESRKEDSPSLAST